MEYRKMVWIDSAASRRGRQLREPLLLPIVILLAVMLLWASAEASDDPPRRRAATIVAGIGNEIDSGFSASSRGLFYAADLVIPSATVAELSSYIRQFGRDEAIRWFCSQYAENLDGSDTGSLETLANTSPHDAAIGSAAADALTCPSPDSELPLELRHVVKAPTLAALGVDGIPMTTGSCPAGDVARPPFRIDDCQRIFSDSPRRKHAFATMMRLAAQRGVCLRFRIHDDSSTPDEIGPRRR